MGTLFGPKRIKARTKSGFQPGHHLIREEVNHPQFQQCLVIRVGRVKELWRTPVLRLPAVQNLRNSRPRLLAYTHEAKHLVQSPIAAVRFAGSQVRLVADGIA